MIILIVLCLTFFGENVYAMGRTQAPLEPITYDIQNETALAVSQPAVSQLAASLSLERQQATRGEQVMKALAAAYPRRIEKAEFRNGDWAVFLENSWYYYADGKMLPEELLYMANDFSPHGFYNYVKKLPEWEQPSPAEAARLDELTKNRASHPRRRSPHFFDALYRARNREEAYQRVKTIRFLGRTVNVHYSVLEELSLVEEHILLAAKTDPTVQTWINSISSLESWSWRNVADTQSRSFHSYGVAVDILPRSLGGKETYWLWASRHKPDWWNISYNNRYHPPDAVILAFERFGFIWGGKWLFFDTMHFEYRPEILILNDMAAPMIR